MVQPTELDTLVALRILIDILRSEGEFARSGEKTRPPGARP